MAADDLRQAIEHLPPGWHPHVFDQVESTMDAARAAALGNAPTRSLFIADFQSAGRGRRGRVWQAPPGQALLMSVLLRGPGPVAAPWRSTALASVSIAEAIEVLLPLTIAIKWPNDLMLDRRKVAGILAESASDGAQFVVVVGIGVNVNVPPDELAVLGVPATSLHLPSNEYVSRADLLIAFATRVDAWLAQTEDALRQAWQARLWGQGQRLRLLDLGVEEDVVVLGVSPDGGLRIRRADGSEHTTTTGELIL
jgi:BirA family biotin operon repressor/biotin-[acetyl-CoA-carboxylase] ligase